VNPTSTGINVTRYLFDSKGTLTKFRVLSFCESTNVGSEFRGIRDHCYRVDCRYPETSGILSKRHFISWRIYWHSTIYDYANPDFSILLAGWGFRTWESYELTHWHRARARSVAESTNLYRSSIYVRPPSFVRRIEMHPMRMYSSFFIKFHAWRPRMASSERSVHLYAFSFVMSYEY